MTAAIYVHSFHSKLNKLLEEFKKLNTDKVVFFNAPLSIELPLAQFHAVHLWKWRAPVMATCVDSAQFLINCNVPLKKYLFVSSPEDWQNGRAAELNMRTYRGLQLVCPIEYKEVVKCVWDVEPLAGNINVDFLEEIFNG